MKLQDDYQQVWELVDKDLNTPAVEGDTVLSFRGKPYTLTGGRPPHKPSSTGRVYTDDGRQYFPSVFGLKWVRVMEDSEKPCH